MTTRQKPGPAPATSAAGVSLAPLDPNALSARDAAVLDRLVTPAFSTTVRERLALDVSCFGTVVGLGVWAIVLILGAAIGVHALFAVLFACIAGGVVGPFAHLSARDTRELLREREVTERLALFLTDEGVTEEGANQAATAVVRAARYPADDLHERIRRALGLDGRHR